ncbi:MAG: RNA methyltransferase [Acidobacteriota bacterium]
MNAPPGVPAPAIVGRHSPRLARLRRISHRQEADLTVADGLRLVKDLLAAGVPIRELYATPERFAALADVAAVKALAKAGRVYLLDPQTMQHVAPTTQAQGLLAVVAEPPSRLPAKGIVLFLDRLQDPGNLGSVIRCAAALGASGVACSPGCADPFAPRAIRASAGQSLFLPIATEVSFPSLAAAVRGRGGEVAATSGSGGRPLSGWRPRMPLLLALGNEGQGLTTEILAESGTLVTIPLTGGVESLNVAVAAGIILASVGLVGSPILVGEEGCCYDSPPRH